MTDGAAIYARFSSENQREASIDDQIRVCTAYLARDSKSVVETYADYAVSGATTLRPGYQALLRDARARRFDVVIAESLDRFSRDQEHIAAFYKHMTFAGVSIVTLAEGTITELHVGLKGTMSALYLKDLAQKTHRGLEGRVRAGRSAGGLCYGYRVIRQFQADGPTAAGMRAIEDAEAIVVRQIFTDYAGGLSPRTIARALNQAKIPGPRGGWWTASLILGNALRETGILRNRLYAGVLVWNRQHFVKDPASGKRVARPNLPTAWIIEPVPALRIIEPNLWTAAQQRLKAARQIVTDERPDVRGADIAGTPGSSLGSRLVATRRPAWLLSGLVRCGLCGGGMTVVGEHGRLGCANYRERDTCTNRRTVLRSQILARVFVGLKDRLLAPELVETFVAEYVIEMNLANRNALSRRSKLEMELARVDRRIRTMVETIADTGGSRTLVEELRAIERKQDQLRDEIVAAGTPEVLPALHPNLAQVYRQKVERLEEALRDPVVRGGWPNSDRSISGISA